MRLFKRKDEDAEQCPECHERIPEGVTECAMCGRDLVAMREDREARTVREAEPAERR
jgi:hypothetical protein